MFNIMILQTGNEEIEMIKSLLDKNLKYLIHYGNRHLYHANSFINLTA